MQWPCQDANKHVHCLTVLGPAFASWVRSSDSQTHDLLACGQLTGPWSGDRLGWAKEITFFFPLSLVGATPLVSRVVISTTRTFRKLLQPGNVYILLYPGGSRLRGERVCKCLTASVTSFSSVRMKNMTAGGCHFWGFFFFFFWRY